MENMIVMTIMNDTVTARINMNDVNIVKNVIIIRASPIVVWVMCRV